MTEGSINLEQIADQISALTLVEAAELVKTLEDKLGVSAAAPVAVAAAGGAAPEAAEEKSEFDISLDAVGDKKIDVIKVVRTVTGLGLKEAKELTESAPKVVKEGVAKAEAEEIKKQFETAGAKVSLK